MTDGELTEMGWLADFFAGRTTKRDVSCSFCGRSYVDVGPFVEGPAEVYICSACCDTASAKFLETTIQADCSFCRRRSPATGPVVQSESGATICGECVDLVRSILEQEARRRAKKERSRQD